MKALRLNFTIAEDAVNGLKACVSPRKRSAFVTEAIREKLKAVEQEQLRLALIEGYSARRKEGAGINKEWEQITLEGLE